MPEIRTKHIEGDPIRAREMRLTEGRTYRVEGTIEMHDAGTSFGSLQISEGGVWRDMLVDIPMVNTDGEEEVSYKQMHVQKLEVIPNGSGKKATFRLRFDVVENWAWLLPVVTWAGEFLVSWTGLATVGGVGAWLVLDKAEEVTSTTGGAVFSTTAALATIAVAYLTFSK